MKLLLMNGVDMQSQTLHNQLLVYRKLFAPTDKNGEEVIRRSCFMGAERKGPCPYNVASRLPSVLIRPYLICRVRQSSDDPCLLSVFIDRSIDLVAEQNHDTSHQDRDRLRLKIAASFNTRLLEEHYSRDSFNSLFDSCGLDYWLPLYDAARLTIYPKPEDNLRLYYIFRLSHIANQNRDPRDDVIRYSPIGDLLASPPATPEYARLFAIDCYNLAVNSNNDLIYNELCFSNTGSLLNTLSWPERIWCAAKQKNMELCAALIDRVLGEPPWVMDRVTKQRLGILVIVEALVQAGDGTHSGRIAVKELLGCKDMGEVQIWARDFDPEGITQIQEKLRGQLLWEDSD